MATIEEMREELATLQQELRDLETEEAEETTQAHEPLEEKLAELEARERELQEARDEAERQCAEEADRRQQTLELMLQQVTQLEAITAELSATESAEPHQSAAELAEIATTREQELKGLYERLEELKKEDAEVTSNLTWLQQKAAKEIPHMQKKKEEILDNIAQSWEEEKRQLKKVYQNNVLVQRELFWHLKRGSYIKQKFTDPRNPKGQFEDKSNDFHDHRLKGEEDKIVREHMDLQSLIEDQTQEKMQLERSRDDMRRRWESGVDAKTEMGKDGYPKVQEGSRAWYQQRLNRLRGTLQKEQRLTRELINENAEMKSVKAGMDDKLRAVQEQLKQDVIEQARALQLKQREEAEDRRKAARNIQTQRVARDPVMLLEPSRLIR